MDTSDDCLECIESMQTGASYPMNYIYECNGRYFLSDHEWTGEHRSRLFAAWPGGVEDCPPAVARTVMAAFHAS